MAGPGRSCDVYAPRLILYCDRRDSLVAFEISHASLDRLGTGRKNEELEIFLLFFFFLVVGLTKKIHVR